MNESISPEAKQMPTPRTDVAEESARKNYEALREAGYPSFNSDGFEHARTLELELADKEKQVEVLVKLAAMMNAAIVEHSNQPSENPEWTPALTHAQSYFAEFKSEHPELFKAAKDSK